jgi:hypothetical protein
MEALGDLWIFGIKYYIRSEGTMAVEQTSVGDAGLFYDEVGG